MGPSCKRRARSSTRKSRKTIYKKQNLQLKSEEASAVAISPSHSPGKSSDDSLKIDGLNFEVFDVTKSACTTPKAEKFRIPEIKTCPPAPKKRRVLSSSSLRRNPIAFFAPPDLELFFFVALRDIST